MQAMETQVKAVKVPIPWEIIKVGGIINDKGLIDSKLIFEICTINKRPRIRRICLELINGFSLFDMRISNMQYIKISKKVMIQLERRLKLSGEDVKK